MGYYCTVPQCTSLAGKTKNVKFHRFPRDVTMADKWNNILKRGKPYTKYSKVCSLHFTQADYNVTTMGQWKTLSKDAVPSQNLPRLNPDGSVMVIRKSRTIKREIKREDSAERLEKYSPLSLQPPSHLGSLDNMVGSEAQDYLPYRLHNLNTLANAISPHQNMNPVQSLTKPKKQDAIMQTDPVQDDNDMNNSYNSDDNSQKSFESAVDKYHGYQKNYNKDTEQDQSVSQQDKMADLPKDYTKTTDYSKTNEDYIPQTNDEYNKEAEKYALERKRTIYDKPENGYHKHGYPKTDSSYPKTDSSYPKTDSSYPKMDSNYQKADSSYSKTDSGYQKTHSYDKVEANYTKNHETYNKVDGDYSKEGSYEKGDNYTKTHEYEKIDSAMKESGYSALNYEKQDFPRDDYLPYQNGYPDPAELLRSQQHNLQMLQEQHRITENQNFFSENHIKQETDLTMDDDKFSYERSKDQIEFAGRRQQRLMDHIQHTLKQEPEHTAVQSQSSPYYPANAHSNMPGGFYDPLHRAPGPELLIAKQNALAAHTQLWQNTMKRPFYYTESPHFNTAPPILHRYEESLSRILQ